MNEEAERRGAMERHPASGDRVPPRLKIVARDNPDELTSHPDETADPTWGQPITWWDRGIKGSLDLGEDNHGS
jgi:hypothetical protein